MMLKPNNAPWVLSLLVGAFGILSILPAQRWQGSFSQVEYRLAFFDQNNKPLKNVILVVEDESGNQVNGFPVTDLHSGSVKTDEDGVVTFHHVQARGAEFSGECHHLFFLIPFGQCQPPSYKCLFVHNGKTIYSIEFNELNRLATKRIVSGNEEVVVIPKESIRWPEETDSGDLSMRLKFDDTDPLQFVLFKMKIVIR